MDEFTQPNQNPGKNQAGCLILVIAGLMLAGLAMWFFLWGRAVPKTDEPATPVEKRQVG